MILDMTIGCYYFYPYQQQGKAEDSAWDVLLRAAMVVGEELAKPDGSTGAGGLFKQEAAKRHRITDIRPEGPMTVRPVFEDGSYKGVLGRYDFGVEYRVDITGGTD